MSLPGPEPTGTAPTGTAPTGTEPTGTAPATSLSRALRVLASFDEGRSEQTLAEIVDATGLPPSTVHRYLQDLVEWGGLVRSARGRYSVGTRLWQLGVRAPRERRLRDVALPFLEDLREATHETVHLAVRDGDRVLYVEKLQGRRRSAISSQVGLHLPLHATGPGKVLLAHGPPALLAEVLAGGLPKVAPRTLTDPSALRRALAQIRQQGFAESVDEMTAGVSSVAAPVFGPQRLVVAAISVALPTGDPRLAALPHAVRVAAAGITRELRGGPPGAPREPSRGGPVPGA